MAKGFIVPVSSKGQVTLPKHVREILRVDLGDYVRFKPVTEGVLLTKIRLAESEEFSEAEWQVLERLANRAGRRYKSAKEFLKDLDRL